MKKIITKTCFFSLLFLLIAFTANARYGPGAAPGNNSSLKKDSHSSHQPDFPASPGFTAIFSATGKYTLSADGAGNDPGSFTIRVKKPNAAATVYKAFLMSTSTTVPLAPGCVTLAGTPVTWNGSVFSSWDFGNYYFYNYWADVTSLVAPVINPLGPGISTILLSECSLTSLINSEEAIEGEALLVIFNDATTIEKTVLIMWGGLDPYSGNYAVLLGLHRHHSILQMGLGISHSRQSGGYSDFTTVAFNTTGDLSGVKSSCAGGSDDGGPFPGKLITVGGIGDSIPGAGSDNPLPGDPPRCDCEHYGLESDVSDSSTTLSFNTSNPTDNNNAFLCYFVASGSINILTGSGIVVAQSTTWGCAGTTHTVIATVMDALGNPLMNTTVYLNVISGPNSGTNGTSVTNSSGHASFTYTSNAVVGTDQIKACFTPPAGGESICSNILNFQWIDCTTCIPTLSQWSLIILGLLLLAAGVVFIQRKQYSFAVTGEAETTSGRKSLFNRRTYFIIWAILLGIAAVLFITEIVLSISIPFQDLAGSLVSSAILAYILQLLIPSRKE